MSGNGCVLTAYEKNVDPLGSERAMRIGWMIIRGQSTRFHNGGTDGFQSALFVNRQLDIGVFVLSNTDNDTVNALAENMFEMKAK